MTPLFPESAATPLSMWLSVGFRGCMRSYKPGQRGSVGALSCAWRRCGFSHCSGCAQESNRWFSLTLSSSLPPLPLSLRKPISTFSSEGKRKKQTVQLKWWTWLETDKSPFAASPFIIRRKAQLMSILHILNIKFQINVVLTYFDQSLVVPVCAIS